MYTVNKVAFEPTRTDEQLQFVYPKVVTGKTNSLAKNHESVNVLIFLGIGRRNKKQTLV